MPFWRNRLLRTRPPKCHCYDRLTETYQWSRVIKRRILKLLRSKHRPISHREPAVVIKALKPGGIVDLVMYNVQLYAQYGSIVGINSALRDCDTGRSREPSCWDGRGAVSWNSLPSPECRGGFRNLWQWDRSYESMNSPRRTVHAVMARRVGGWN